MKFYSKIFKAKTIVSVFIIIWIIILILITINHTLSCVDLDGCLKKSCQKRKDNEYISYIRSSYSVLLEKSCKKENN